MDFIATKVEEILAKVSPIKRFFIRDVAREYYRKGYEDGQKLVHKVILKGNALREFADLLDHCGIKLSYNLKKGGLIVSIRPDKIEKLQNLIKAYKENDKY